MLYDAVKSEMVRIWHNGTAIFWGLFFIPLASLFTGIFWRTYLEAKTVSVRDIAAVRQLLGAPSMNLGDKLTEKAAILAEPGLMAFFILMAAAVFAADYRWETWRLIRAKNSRENLLLGKVITVSLLALVPMLTLLLAEAMGQIVSATIDNDKIVLGFDLKQFLATLTMIIVAWLRVCQFAMLALMTAVITRSIAASIMLPVAIAVGTFLLQRVTGLIGWDPYGWATMLSFPSVGHETIQGALLGAKTDGATIVRALIGLLLWLGAPLAIALWLFPKQDLAKE